MNNATKIVLGITGIVLFIIYSALAYGYVFSTLWSWFMVPLGLPVISIAHAIGISAIAGLFKHHGTPNKTLSYKGTDLHERVIGTDYFIACWTIALMPWSILAFGWIAKQYL